MAVERGSIVEFAVSGIDPNILNPFIHTAGVKLFHQYFEITQKPANLEYLKEILFHFSKLPYENLSKIISHSEETDMIRKLRLPLEVMEGYISHKLGGTCFSLTFFLYCILVHAGYSCYPVMADMKWAQNSHCVLILLYDGSKYLVDPGYLFNQPMELHPQKPRIYDSDFSGIELAYREELNTYEVYTFNRTEMKWRYRFQDRPCPLEEFLRFWVSSFYWNSMHGLCLTRAERGRLIYVHKYFMRESTYEGKANYNIKKDYHQKIYEAFGIEPVIVERALSALAINMARERELGLWTPSKKDSLKIKEKYEN